MKRSVLILGLLVVAAVAGAAIWWIFRPSGEMVLSGVVEIQEVRLSSKVGGRVARLAVQEGDLVPAGTSIVYLDLPELEAKRAQAQAEVEQAQAVLARVV